MSREYELALRLNAELESRFNRTFSEANNRITELERNLRGLDRLGRGGGSGGFGAGLIGKVSGIGKAAGVAAGVGIAGGVVAAGAIVGSSIEKAMSFESQISTIEALTGASNKEMAKMEGLALKMGASTKYSALEAAQGIEELLKAGLTPAAVQTGGLEAALNLATAGGLELASAAEIMSTALNAFKKDGMTAAEASNILAGTANASATSVEELQYSLAAVGSVADGVGLSFKDTSIAMGLFANNGLKGSDAGTSLKTMLSNLQPKTKETTALFKKLGLTTANGSNAFYDAEGNIKSLEEISGALQKALKKQTNQQRALTLETIFGSDAVRAGNILFKEGAEGVKNFTKEMSKVTALDVARKKMDNAAGAVEQFKGALETLQISALTPTLPIIKDLASAAADVVANYTPQITAGMERMVNGARNYVNDHFLQNPEFKKLQSFESKVDFIFTDVMDSFTKWWDSGGSASFEGVTSRLSSKMVNLLDASVPEMTRIGLKMGEGLASGMWDGLKDSKVGWVFKGSEKISDFVSPDWLSDLTSGNYLDAAKNFMWPGWGNKDKQPDPAVVSLSPFQPKMQEYAYGGYADRPSIFGEAGPEMAIPLNNSSRSRQLWETTGHAIGALSASSSDSNGATQVIFKAEVTINGGSPEVRNQVREGIKEAANDFEKRYDTMMAQRRRLSFG